MPDHLIVSDEDATRVITMRRPEKKNAITQDMYREMRDAINSVQDNPDIRCIVITGGNGVFTAGNDLEDFLKDGTSSSDAPRKSNAIKFLYALAHNTKPIVAAVDGIAIGIGTTMLFHCDYVVASTTATFSTPFIHLGLVPEGASSLLMPHHGTPARFLDPGDGPHGLSRGRAHRRLRQRRGGVRARPKPRARKVAREIGALPAEAVAISRKLLRPSPEDLNSPIDQESHLFGERMRSAEAVAAFKAFFSRKKA